MANVTRVVELSHVVGPDTQVYPGDPVPRLSPVATIDADGCNVLHVEMGSQSGTHVDAPYHFRSDGARIDAMEPAAFVGTGVLADVTGKPPRAGITAGDLAGIADELRPGRILLLHTGWDRHWGTEAYFDHPFLDADAARRVLDLGVRTIGLDAPSIDETVPDGPHPTGFACHHLIARAGGVIAENLTGLSAVDFPDPLVSLLPIRLANADGAPVRAVALRIES